MKLEGGFTLVEMVVTVALLSVLAVAAMPMAEFAVKRTKERELRQALSTIRAALDAHKAAADAGLIVVRAEGNGYPDTLESLVEGVPDAKTPGRRVYFLRRLPTDPFEPSGRWGLRSYASSPDRPRPGDDVFDVFSLSTGRGSDGRPLSAW